MGGRNRQKNEFHCLSVWAPSPEKILRDFSQLAIFHIRAFHHQDDNRRKWGARSSKRWHLALIEVHDVHGALLCRARAPGTPPAYVKRPGFSISAWFLNGGFRRSGSRNWMHSEQWEMHHCLSQALIAVLFMQCRGPIVPDNRNERRRPLYGPVFF